MMDELRRAWAYCALRVEMRARGLRRALCPCRARAEKKQRKPLRAPAPIFDEEAFGDKED